MEKQISIIIPTYNMEKYIGKCLDSLLIPEFDQVEVLVVNDGSKDRSSEIAHNYADRYPDSIRVIDKQNGNYGSCINTALPLCTGRYVKILDADDTFDTAAFSELVKLLPSVNDDVIITPFCVVNENGDVITNRGFNGLNIVLNASYQMNNYKNEFDEYQIQMHQIVFKTALFNEFPYQQTEGISYTDSEWATIPFIFAKTYRCIRPNITHYLTGREGQTLSSEQIQKFFNNFIIVLKNIVSHYTALPNNQPISKFLFHQIMKIHEYVYFKSLSIWSKGASDQIRLYDIWIKNVAPDIYKAIGEIPYTDKVNFKIFSHIRERIYIANYKIPFTVRAKVSLLAKLNRIFRK